MQNIQISEDELKKINQESETVYFKSSFNFLNEHNGIRPGNMHLLLSTTGAGKSSLVRKIILDSAQEYRAMVWLSEESCQDFKLAMSSCYPDPEAQKNIYLVSELDFDESVSKSHIKVYEHFEKMILLHRPHIVFLDNITTSGMYSDVTPSEQSNIAWKIKRLCQRQDVPIFIIAHTGKTGGESNGRMINETDIRGSKAITNLVEYLYVLQGIETETTRHGIVRIVKHRGQAIGHYFFFLFFDKKKRLYINDRKLKFSEFKAMFKDRNKL